MREMLLVFALAFAAATAQEQGNPDHREPPPGWFCSPAGTGDHKCSCQRMGDPHDSCESVTESPACKVYCFKDHCRCPIVCEKEKSS